MNKQDIHDMIRDYRWMINLLIARRFEAVGSSQGLTTIYGIEATLPKPQGTNTDPVYQEYLRIEEYEQNNKKIREKVLFIQRHSKAIKDVQNKIILNRLLDGESLKEIAKDMNMSASGINYRKELIVDEMYNSYVSAQKEQTVKTGT